MVRCPNCGQKTSGDFCQWCQYPLLKGRRAGYSRFIKRVNKQAKLATQEEAKRKAEEEKQTRLAAQAEAKRKAEEEKQTAQEEARKKAEEERLAAINEARGIKQTKKSLKQIAKTSRQLRAGKIDTKEAIEKLSDITDNITK